MKNIVLIGMPSAGKSTVGVVLSKAAGFSFVDTDLIIQENEKRFLQDVIAENGIRYFLDAEERALLNLNVEHHVVATGGSVIYSEASMLHLKGNSIIFYLKISYAEMTKRINNISTRGIAIRRDQNLSDLYAEREPLYSRYADYTINCDNRDIESIITEIMEITAPVE
jgi:shikimate kinase